MTAGRGIGHPNSRLTLAMLDGCPKRSHLVALFAGSVRNLWNQGNTLLAGEPRNWWKTGPTCCVPDLVATCDAVTMRQQARIREGKDR